MSPAERLRMMYSDPEFATARDQRGRWRFSARHQELQRLSNATRRGEQVAKSKTGTVKSWDVLREVAKHVYSDAITVLARNEAQEVFSCVLKPLMR